MRRALLLASLLGAAAAGAQSTSTVGLIRTDDGGTQDGGPTFNGFVLQHPLVAKGDLSKDDIRKVVEAHQLEIRDCYHALLKRSARKKPLPQGTVKLKFEVSPEGTVKTADLAPGGNRRRRLHRLRGGAREAVDLPAPARRRTGEGLVPAHARSDRLTSLSAGRWSVQPGAHRSRAAAHRPRAQRPNPGY